MIETALYQHLMASESLRPFLATYANELAIFNQEAPSDIDGGWGRGSQYGRIVYNVDLTGDPERRISGVLLVDVLCEKGRQLPEEVEPVVRPLIDGYFFSVETVTMAAQWRASDYFATSNEKVVGVTLTFDLLAFPKQTTIEPDPIALINKWTSENIEGAKVIGYTELPASWKATDDNVAIYWKLSQIQKCNWIPDTYNCSWQTAVIDGFIMTESENLATSIARCISNMLTIKKRLIFDDKSPLMVDRSISVASTHDRLRIRAITIDATYGILTPLPPRNPLNHISVNGREVQENV